MKHLSVVAACVVAILCLPSTRSFSQEPPLEDTISQARRAKPEDAVKMLKKAIKARDGKCLACWAEIAESYRKLNAFKDAAGAGQKVLELANNDRERARGHFEIGWSYMSEAQAQKKSQRLPEAERELREALKLDDTPMVHYALGRVLLMQSKDPEGIAELKGVLESNLASTHKKEAEQLIDNPRRAREPIMPEFSVTTLDGKFLSNDELAGKIVVLDFWGTWCPPCVASVGEMRGLANRFKNEPDVLVLSISTDTDEAKLREFIEEHKMDWTQAWDKGRTVTRAFGVNSFPTYLVVDRDGLMRRVEHGGGGNQIAEVGEQVKKMLKDSRKKETKVAVAQ
jgi:peroxiredoxin